MRENEALRRDPVDFDADAEKIRNEIIRMLSGPAASRAEARPLGEDEELEASTSSAAT